MAGIYIHIPFCKQACNYCNFYFSTSLGNKDAFIAALLKEIELSQSYLQGEPVQTIYFGGGTPSMLSASELSAIVNKIAAHHTLNLKEFTIEANPDDLTEQKVKELAQLKPLGFNRFSIGIQSFFDDDLKYMNRAHNSAEALTSIYRVQDAGFSNLTIDLIYGTPTMNNEQWQKNIEKALSLNIPHISAYALTVEDKTPLERKIKTGKSKPVNEEQSANQFRMLINELQAAGFEQYEISNFAKPGMHAIHNSNYWFGQKYLGLGPSAHSFNGSARRWNVRNNFNYIASINNGALPFEQETLTPAQQVNEKIMTSLRTMWGLQLNALPAHFAPLVAENLKAVNPEHYILNRNTLVLSPEGKLFADGIAATLFVDDPA